MKIKILMHYLVMTLLVGTPLFGMDLSTDTDEETQPDTELSIGSFFSAQVDGARQLLSYSRCAAEDLVRMSRPSEMVTETGQTISTLKGTNQLLSLFLSDEAAYRVLAQSFPRDIRQLLAQSIQYYQPFKKIMQAKLGAHCSFLSLKHDGYVMSAKCNRAGDRVITACKDETSNIWDVKSGIALKMLRGHHSSFVRSAQFNARGDRAVTASNDHTAKIWDVGSGNWLQTLNGHINCVLSAVFNGVGDRILTISDDHTAKLWDVVSGNCLHTLQGNTAEFNEAGDRIITASEDRTVKLWDVASGKHLKTFAVLSGEPQSAYFTRAGDSIVAGTSRSWTVHIWNIESGTLLLLNDERLLSRPQSFPSGDKIITASHDETIKIWDVGAGICLMMLQGHQGHAHAAQFNASKNIIITASRSGAIQIFNAFSGQLLYTLKGPPLGYYPQQLDVTDDRIVVASEDSRAVIWDSESLFAASKWLERECTLEQALLLHCIYETRIVARGLQKKYKHSSSWLSFLQSRSDAGFKIDPRFDFNHFPHLQKYFHTMPPLVQDCLLPFVKLTLIKQITQ